MTSNLDVLRSRSGGSFKGKLRASRSPEENRLYPWLHAHACDLESGAAGVHAPAPAALDAEAPAEEENVRGCMRQVLDAGAGLHAQVIKNPRMTAGGHATYAWTVFGSCEPVFYSALGYMRRLVARAEDIMTNLSIAPRQGRLDALECMGCARLLLRRFFRVYAHAYLHHFEAIRGCGWEDSLNQNLERFIYLVKVW